MSSGGPGPTGALAQRKLRGSRREVPDWKTPEKKGSGRDLRGHSSDGYFRLRRGDATTWRSKYPLKLICLKVSLQWQVPLEVPLEVPFEGP